MGKLSSEVIDFVKKELTRYETKESAIIPSLYKVQEHNDGWVPAEIIAELSAVMEIPESRINEVFHFYTMFNKVPVGRHHVQVCCNVACCMAGTRELFDEFLQKYGAKPGEVTSDGKFTFTKVECLGACDKAPMMQVNDDYHEGLTTDSAHNILQGLN